MRCAAAARRGLCSCTSSSRYLGKLLQRLRLRVCVRLRTCWLSYSCLVVLYRCLVLVVWLWFGCSMVVVVGGCSCWRLWLLAFVVSCEGVRFKNQMIELKKRWHIEEEDIRPGNRG
jgi:hypothetical protein